MVKDKLLQTMYIWSSVNFGWCKTKVCVFWMVYIQDKVVRSRGMVWGNEYLMSIVKSIVSALNDVIQADGWVRIDGDVSRMMYIQDSVMY